MMDAEPYTTWQAANATSRAHRIAIASGKGGVGKTWFAITLAQAMAEDGARVLLFDGDLGLANIDIQLGLAPKLDLGAVLAGRVELTAAITDYATGGFHILAGHSGSLALASVQPARLEAVLGELGGLDYTTILLDLGAGVDANTRRMAVWADTLLVLATDEPTSLTDAYAVLKLHTGDHGGADARIVVNQAASPAAGHRTFATLSLACQNFLGHTPPLAGIIRRDDRVRETIRRQTPLLTRHPGCAAALDVREVARLLR